MVEIEYRKARIKLGNIDLVYEPAEDSFLLADAALKEAKAGMRILEIGTGSGFVSTVLLENLKDICLVATEINPNAATCAKTNGVEVIRTDLFKGLKSRDLETHFDLILFNPPFLPLMWEDRVD